MTGNILPTIESKKAVTGSYPYLYIAKGIEPRSSKIGIAAIMTTASQGGIKFNTLTIIDSNVISYWLRTV